MKNSKALPPFAGRCTAHELVAQVSRRAHQARYLRDFRALSPEALCRLAPDELRARTETSVGAMLLAMCAVLLLAFALLRPAHPTAPQGPTPSPAFTAAPVGSTTWSYE